MSALGGKRTLARLPTSGVYEAAIVKMSVLRDIGWDQWDPIGLSGSEGGWRRSHAADEYDRYMWRVADGLRRGESDESLVDYLVSIETLHMGLTETPATRVRARATITSVREHLASII